MRMILPDADFERMRCGQTIPRGTILGCRHPDDLSHEGDCPPTWTPTLLVLETDDPGPQQLVLNFIAAVRVP